MSHLVGKIISINHLHIVPKGAIFPPQPWCERADRAFFPSDYQDLQGTVNRYNHLMYQLKEM